jgi:hypothetical protein
MGGLDAEFANSDLRKSRGVRTFVIAFTVERGAQYDIQGQRRLPKTALIIPVCMI